MCWRRRRSGRARTPAVLKDTHWVGGDPRWLQVYGWASWTPEKAILTLRNPSDKAQDFRLDVGQAFELPPGAARRFRAHSPWHDEAAAADGGARSGGAAHLPSGSRFRC